MQKSLTSFILLSGLLVGSADITLACVNAYARNHVPPERVLKYVASGAFGKEAFSGGPWMIALGLLFHFMIAFSFTLLFFYAYPKIKWLGTHKIITGILYGLFVWIVMDLMVLPQTNVPPFRFLWSRAVINLLILIVAIGLPLSFLASGFYSGRRKEKKNISG